jgi:hypothetical protein
MNHITLNWSAEDRLRIDKLIGLLEQVVVAAEAADVIERKVVEEIIYEPDTAAETPQEAPEPVEQEQTPPEPENAQDEPQAAEEAAPTPKYTAEDVRAKAKELTAAGKRAEAKTIVNEYAASITDLPADKCDEVMARLTALEG